VIYTNNIHFVREGSQRVRLSLESDFTLTGGLEPNVNAAVVTAEEFAKLGGDFISPGRLEFFFTPAGADGTTTAAPDVSIEPIYIVEARIGTRGIRTKNGPLQTIDYKLFLADRRQEFVLPRGGHLRVGKLNGDDTPAAKWKTNRRLIEICLAVMGLGTIAGQVFVAAENGTAVSLGEIPEEIKQRNLDWGDAHAPTELARLLHELGLVMSLRRNGSFRIEQQGVGAVPSIPAERLIAELVDPGLDRRADAVIITTAPNPIIETRTISGVKDGAWQFVGMDISGQWKPLNELTYLGNKTAIEHMHAKFGDLDEAYRGLAKRDWYQCIRLDPAEYGRVRLMRLLHRDAERKLIITARAKIAVKDETTGTWSNSGGMVTVTPHLLEEAKGPDPADWTNLITFPVLRFTETLIQVDPQDAGDPVQSAKKIGEDDLEVELSYAIYEQRGPDPADLVPVPFAVGFYRNGDGSLTEMTDAEIRTAMLNAKTAVIRKPEWSVIKAEGLIQEHDKWRAEAKAIAKRFMRGTAQPKEIHVVGFFGIDLSGVVSEVRISQRDPKTTIHTDTWHLPRGGMYAETIKKIEEQRKAQERNVTATRSAVGHDTQPVVTLGPGAGSTAAVGEAIIHARITGATRQGTAFKWVYSAWLTEKAAGGAGYGGWATKGGENSITLYNLAEDMNDSSGLMGNGVDTANLAGTGLHLMPIPTGRDVRVWRVSVPTTPGQLGGPVTMEYWCDVNNAIDGSCTP
jgi:hypothetical protein